MLVASGIFPPITPAQDHAALLPTGEIREATEAQNRGPLVDGLVQIFEARAKAIEARADRIEKRIAEANATGRTFVDRIGTLIWLLWSLLIVGCITGIVFLVVFGAEKVLSVVSSVTATASKITAWWRAKP